MTAVKYSSSLSPQRDEKDKLIKEPGPGQYTIKSTIGGGPGAVLLGKPKERKIERYGSGYVPFENTA